MAPAYERLGAADGAGADVGLGLVIGPLSSAALRVVPAAQHGIASASVVVARMTGMLIGVAALSAWGLYRFSQILASMPPEATAVLKAFALMYGDIFKVTVVICVVGALLGLLIGARHEHAEEQSTVEPERPAGTHAQPLVDAEAPAATPAQPAVNAEVPAPRATEPPG